MAQLFNFGSLNVDWVYRVPHVVRPGETLASASCDRFAGGKGANQSVAASRAGQRVEHVGAVGPDGRWLVELLAEVGVGVEAIAAFRDTPTGHAVIQVTDAGENAICIFPGANHLVGRDAIDAALSTATPDDWVLTQNETANAVDVLASARASGLRVALNPAPMTDDIVGLDFCGVALLIVNETEASAMSEERDRDPLDLAASLVDRGAGLAVVTLGGGGVVACDGSQRWRIAGHRVERVADTTAAGDTFVGFMVSALMQGLDVEAALNRANTAAAICVSRRGAIASIPMLSEVVASLSDAGARSIAESM